MKKLFSITMSILLLFCCVSCSADESTSSSGLSLPDSSTATQSASSQVAETYYTNPLTGENNLSEDAVAKRPIGVMINNIKVSLPQRGIGEADLLYEVLAEGGITRILAMFADINKIGDLGSLRSARNYYFELASSHNAIYAHFGGSSYALNEIKQKGVKTINFLSGKGFYRDQNRINSGIPREHTAFTNAELLKERISALGIKTDGAVSNAFKFGDNSSALSSASVANNITAPFSSYNKATFTYDSKTGLYKKGQFNKDHIDGTTNKPITVKNVFVLQTSISMMDSSSSYIKVDLSSGNGYYACDGKILNITWKKNGFNNQLKYYTADGRELTVSPGKTYVCIIPKNNKVTFN